MSHLSRRSVLAGALAAGSFAWPSRPFAQGGKPPGRMQSWPLKTPRTTGIHDLAPSPDGGVWFTAQRSGHLGWFDPSNGHTALIALGSGSSPHGVIQGPDGAAWITDSGLNAFVQVSWPHREVRQFALPEGTPYANLNTCAVDGDGDLWFTGQSGVIGKVAVKTGTVIMSITGLSMAARAHRVVDRAEAEKVIRMLPLKYPDAPPQMAAMQMPTPEEVALFRVVPKVISVPDYTKGFAHTDLVTC